MALSRSKRSLLNAITALAMTLVNGLLGIVVTRFVIESFGSDFNGVNSTANQIVSVLLVLEGGFTLASNVALFAPFTSGDYLLVNSILAATKAKFKKIGLIFLGIGLLVAVGYAGVVNSGLPFDFVATVIVMTIVPAAFNLYYATTYRVLLQTQQKEYVINLITMATLGLGHGCNILMISRGGPMWMVRFITMMCALLNSLLIGGYVKRKNPFLNLHAEPRGDLIKGTGDVMVQKITGIVYNSAPIVFLSISPSGGTVLASVYAVYNNVFVMLKSLMHGIIDAPRHSFGQILTEREREDVWPVFAQYEYVAFCAIHVLLTTCYVLILPFIQIYTDGISDANYSDLVIATLMVLITVMEMIHIPSGHLINMAGMFRISKNFQLISCIVLIISMVIGGMYWGVYGMLMAILLVAVMLAIMEMGYIHAFFFKKKLIPMFVMLLPLFVTGFALCVVESNMNIVINGYLDFVLCGVLLVVANGLATVLVSLIFARKTFLCLVRRMLALLARVKH